MKWGPVHSITALYEVKLHEGSSGSVGTRLPALRGPGHRTDNRAIPVARIQQFCRTLRRRFAPLPACCRGGRIRRSAAGQLLGPRRQPGPDLQGGLAHIPLAAPRLGRIRVRRPDRAGSQYPVHPHRQLTTNRRGDFLRQAAPLKTCNQRTLREMPAQGPFLLQRFAFALLA